MPIDHPDFAGEQRRGTRSSNGSFREPLNSYRALDRKQTIAQKALPSSQQPVKRPLRMAIFRQPEQRYWRDSAARSAKFMKPEENQLASGQSLHPPNTIDRLP